MKVWLTKYALSQGIKECEVEEIQSHYVRAPMYPFGMFKVGRDCELTEDSARAKAEEMRQRRIASLKKQLAKLEAMSF